jgi:uncharacterized protein YjdB
MKRVANRLALIATLLLATAHAQQPRLQITSPANNAVVAVGQATTITVSADSSVQIIGVITESPLPEVRATSSPSQFLLAVPGSVPPGVYNLTAIGISSKHAVNSNPVAIRVERSTSPVGIDVGPTTLYLHSVGDQFPLEVKGLFADGTSADISHSSRVLYTSNDPRVVTVSSDGMVTAIGAGKTTILVRAGVPSSYTYAAAKVEVPEQPSTAAPPVIISVDPKSGIPD